MGGKKDMDVGENQSQGGTGTPGSQSGSEKAENIVTISNEIVHGPAPGGNDPVSQFKAGAFSKKDEAIEETIQTFIREMGVETSSMVVEMLGGYEGVAEQVEQRHPSVGKVRASEVECVLGGGHNV